MNIIRAWHTNRYTFVLLLDHPEIITSFYHDNPPRQPLAMTAIKGVVKGVGSLCLGWLYGMKPRQCLFALQNIDPETSIFIHRARAFL